MCISWDAAHKLAETKKENIYKRKAYIGKKKSHCPLGQRHREHGHGGQILESNVRRIGVRELAGR